MIKIRFRGAVETHRSCRKAKSVLMTAVVGLSAAPAAATTYSYTNLTSATDQWSAGTSWSATPVSDSTTTLAFGPGALSAGTTIQVNNDNSGNFQLNQLTATYTGPAGGVSPLVTISGNALEFVDNGGVAPVVTLTSNASTTFTSSKPTLSLTNDLVLGAPTLTINASSNSAAGPTIAVTGNLSYSTGGAHTLNLGGTSVAATLASSISNETGGGATNLVKSGNGTWILTGSNAYTGGTSISGGILQTAGALGTGGITVSSGAQAYLTGATYSNLFYIAGTGQAEGALRLGGATTISNTVTLLSDARITNTGFTTFATISGKLTGAGGVTFGSGTANTNSRVAISNTLNDYAGNTVVTATGTSGGTHTLRLDADEVIPNGVGKGNLVISTSGSGGRVARVEINGHSETINGLSAVYAGNSKNDGDSRMLVVNGAATAATLTLGDADTSASYFGQIANGSTGVLNIVKTGSGTQTLAARSSYTGATTINGGTILVDVNQFATTVGSAATNYFTTNSDLTLGAGTTFAIRGRTDGTAVSQSGVGLSQFAESITVSDATAAGLVVGQLLTFTGGTGSVADAFVVNITDIAGANATLNLNKRPTSTNTTVTLTTTASTGTTAQTLKSLNLAGAAGTTHTIDFGAGATVVLTINALTQTNDGSRLLITNWSGVTDVGGGTERLMILGDITAFQTTFTQDEIAFAGWGPGYALIDGTPDDGIFEIAANVPEPSSLALLGLGATALLTRRRRK